MHAQALETWGETGVPARPGAWLTTTARNRARDLMRRESGIPPQDALLVADETVPGPVEALDDDRLRLIFTCSHPALSTGPGVRALRAHHRYRPVRAVEQVMTTEPYASAQVEIYFSVVQRKALTPDDFLDLDDVTERLLSFEDRYNRIARPLSRISDGPGRQPVHFVALQGRQLSAAS
ncbi:hypothetical protein OG205_10570 [Lentzea sp. NBC_00516]|uniref:hypothetical protein n=1 Tax=Lentzea sp. NBC_00516 TaxID=2903582 RepID=UPI002E809BDB|nr:hypothetical protein [Lentzea sp. NBC_00516]WUD27407.1 hypothetical protein OG205_10570 [Lentzea sp. NBC_00516]